VIIVSYITILYQKIDRGASVFYVRGGGGSDFYRIIEEFNRVGLLILINNLVEYKKICKKMK
jgi:hypothetical protein